MLELNQASFIPLPWDSAFFGIPTARILSTPLNRNGLCEVLDQLADSSIELAYWNTDPKDMESNRAAAECKGFFADVKTTYTLEPLVLDATQIRHVIRPFPEWVDLGNVKVTQGIPVHATGSSLLYALAVDAGKHSRFQVDPLIPPELFRNMYQEWMRKSLSGEMADAVLVAIEAETLVGMITVKGHASIGSIGTIGLLAVDAGYHRRGLGSSLIQSALKWFSEKACVKTEVVTQERNVEACHLYTRNGFKVTEKVNVWHFRPTARAWKIL